MVYVVDLQQDTHIEHVDKLKNNNDENVSEISQKEALQSNAIPDIITPEDNQCDKILDGNCDEIQNEKLKEIHSNQKVTDAILRFEQG